MVNRLILSLIFSILFTSISKAETNVSISNPTSTSSKKVDSILGNKEFAENSEITDARLKAEEGSRSKYSMKLSLSYAGPPVGDPLAKDQPNPDNNPGNFSTALGGSVSMRYRFDPKTALSAGTGISALTPFHGVERVDVKTPYISYDLSGRIADLQTRNSFGASVTTIPNYIQIGQVAGLGYDNNLVYEIGTSGFAAGIDTSLNYYIYNREFEKKDGKASRYSIGFYPNFKYSLSDKASLVTSIAFMYANLRSAKSETSLINKIRTGRLGGGYAFTKSVYFAPYLNFMVEEFNWDTTTINFSTTFSLF